MNVPENMDARSDGCKSDLQFLTTQVRTGMHLIKHTMGRSMGDQNLYVQRELVPDLAEGRSIAR